MGSVGGRNPAIVGQAFRAIHGAGLLDPKWDSAGHSSRQRFLPPDALSVARRRHDVARSAGPTGGRNFVPSACEGKSSATLFARAVRLGGRAALKTKWGSKRK